MTREVIRVEPLSTYLERVKAPACVATRHNDTVYVSGLPPFDPATGSVVVDATIERQAELVLAQLKLCVETAGSSLENVLNATSIARRRKSCRRQRDLRSVFPANPPARIFVCVPKWLDHLISKSTASRRCRVTVSTSVLPERECVPYDRFGSAC